MAKPTKPNAEAVIELLRKSSHDANAEQLSKVCYRVLRPMMLLYYPPFYADDELHLAEQTEEALGYYIRALKGYDDATLKTAWDSVVAAHKRTGWPVIADIVSACQASAPRHNDNRPTFQPGRALNPASYAADNYQRLIDDFMRTNAGLVSQAKAEGWWPRLVVNLRRHAIAAAQDEFNNRGVGLNLTADEIAGYRRAAA